MKKLGIGIITCLILIYIGVPIILPSEYRLVSENEFDSLYVELDKQIYLKTNEMNNYRSRISPIFKRIFQVYNDDEYLVFKTGLHTWEDGLWALISPRVTRIYIFDKETDQSPQIINSRFEISNQIIINDKKLYIKEVDDRIVKKKKGRVFVYKIK